MTTTSPSGAAVPAIEVEQDLYEYQPANNGAGPQWCFGSPTVVRIGDDVFASGLETIPDAKPLNNTRWTLHRVPREGRPQRVYSDEGRTREPSPIGTIPGGGKPGGKIFVTANPTIAAIDAYSGPAVPTLFEFRADHPEKPVEVTPVPWGEPVQFTEHSYRSFAVDAARGQAFYLNNIGYDLAHWSFRDADGGWPAQGRVRWPRVGAASDSQPLRVCYPSVVLHDKAVHIFGASDIQEPDAELNKFKFELTKNKWDYVFCRVFHAWTPDITREPFRPWVEVASQEATRGTLLACDLFRAADGVMHLLWHEQTVDTRLKAKFFPEAKPWMRLMHARMRDGRVEASAPIIEGEMGVADALPEWGRFHVTPSGRLMVLACVSVGPVGGDKRLVNRLIPLDAAGKPGRGVDLPFEHPFKRLFFTATPRGGSPPSPWLDVVGECAGRANVIRYARVRVE
ncbi:MAG: hypothetical protein NTW19_04650 [Planctomycetota bacterium]|nr:hypothetical protein [Planctomycetota bacterium]